MKSVSFLFVLGLVLAGCGDGTVGPLGGDGLGDRVDLRSRVDGIRGFASADTRPLDALIYLSSAKYAENDDGIYTTLVEGSIIDIRGQQRFPLVRLGTQTLYAGGNEFCYLDTVLADTVLHLSFTWPDTTIQLTHRMLNWTSIGGDTFTYKRTWSLSQGGVLDLPGVRGDSVMQSITDVTQMGSFPYLSYDVIPDTGFITIPSRVLQNTVAGKIYLVETERAFFTVYEIDSPTITYGPRRIGILQTHRIPALIRFTD